MAYRWPHELRLMQEGNKSVHITSNAQGKRRRSTEGAQGTKTGQ